MMKTTGSISQQHARALVIVCSMLAAGNWYLRPERAAAWAAALLLMGCMALALGFAARGARQAGPRSRAAGAIGSGVVFAGAMMAVSLAVKLAVELGMLPEPEVSRRASMVILGAFLVFTGNALPKTLTPLSELRCDGARVQAFQRFAGWTWVLTGIAFALAWLVLPIAAAKPVSTSFLVAGMLAVAAQLVRLRWTAR